MRQELKRMRPQPGALILVLLGLVVGLLALPRSSVAETRVALVIGNTAYRTIAPLANPAADARTMAQTLTAAGFELIGGGPQLDLDKAGLERAIRAFGRRLARDAVGLFYYAGHGVQINGANYLVPVDANLTGPADVKYELVDAGFVLDEMTAAGSRLNLMILDACRNNPFAASGLRSIGRGLAQMTAPAGTLIGYATQPGEVAADGDGLNSPYTAALSQAIIRPGLTIFDMFNNVGIAVKAATGGRQQPWLASSPIEGQFFFTPPRVTAPPTAEAASTSAPTPPGELSKAERLAQVPPAPAVAPPAPASPATTPAGVTLEICPGNFTSIPASVPALTCGCPASAMRPDTLQGDNPYTPISSICTAALHAGALTATGGQVTVMPVGDVPFFPNVRRNGINSLGSSGGAGFRVAVPAGANRPGPVGPDGAVALEICPGNFTSIPARIPSLTCGCPASAMRPDTVQGDNPYSLISSICTAALHAGALTATGGQVTVMPVRDVPFFPNVRRNGINSLGSSGGAGFRVAVPGVNRPDPVGPDGAVTLEICPGNFTSIPARIPSLTCGCPASAMRPDTLQGDNPYTPISSICTAALHAGALTATGGQVTVMPVRDVPFFPNVRRNGINSLGSSGGAGFQVQMPQRDARLDATGRPVQQAIAPALKSIGVVQLYINFATDRAEPLPSSTPVLRELLAALRDSPDLAVELIGHTDSTGGATHNQDLSQRRAAAIAGWLMRNGVDGARLRSAGRGMAEPIADNSNEAGRALNRRVEVKALR